MPPARAGARPSPRRSPDSGRTLGGRSGKIRCDPRRGARRLIQRRPSPRPRGPARSGGTRSVWGSSRSLHAEWARFDAPGGRQLVSVEAHADLAQRLEHVLARALRRAVDALTNRFEIGVVTI